MGDFIINGDSFPRTGVFADFGVFAVLARTERAAALSTEATAAAVTLATDFGLARLGPRVGCVQHVSVSVCNDVLSVGKVCGDVYVSYGLWVMSACRVVRVVLSAYHAAFRSLLVDLKYKILSAKLESERDEGIIV